jgi:hypothetical protein
MFMHPVPDTCDLYTPGSRIISEKADMNIPSRRQNPCRIHTSLPGILALVILLVVLAVPNAGASDNNQTDNTYCQNRFNLAPENSVQISVPTVVDIDVKTGNLLVRGQVPLVVRDGPGNRGGCRKHADWNYAYEGLDALIQNKNAFSPAYFNAENKNEEKIAALRTSMANFKLDDYEVIDISLLTSTPGGNDMVEFATIRDAFGGVSSTCNATLNEGSFHGQNGSAILSDFYFCNSGAGEPDCMRSVTADNVNPGSCSYASRIDQIVALIGGEGQKPGTKRLIYYHCSQGSDRTGAVTMGYLQKTIPGISFVHALHYAQYLGKETQGNDPIWSVNDGAKNSALAYCHYIGADCTTTEAPRILLPGSDTHSHLPGQEDPVITPSPTAVPVPVQTPVPAERYNPKTADSANF